jgi:hypothetical protein
MKPRRAIALSLVVLLGVLAVAHWHLWYRPRPRAMAPAASTLLPRGAEPGLRLWIPYPHQNLRALEEEVEDLEALLAAGARLAGLPPPALPRLEPFGYPPARELQLRSRLDGEGSAAELLPYPMVRGLARLAGALASNPWLTGGAAEVRGRPWQVRWDGPVWQAAEGARAESEGLRDRRAVVPLHEPVLGLLELSHPSPPLPAGRFRLAQRGGELAITSLPEGAPEPPSVAPRFADQELVLLFLRQRQGEGLEALVLFDRDAGLAPGFPSAAALGVSRRARDLLPAGRALSRLGRLPARRLGESTLVATDHDSLEQAAGQIDWWQELAAVQEPRGELETGVWVATGPASERSRRLLRFLEGFPLTPPDELERWRDITLLLDAAAERYSLIEAWVTAEAAELRAR